MRIVINCNLGFDKRVLDDPNLDNETKKDYLFEMSQGCLSSRTIEILNEKNYFQIEDREEILQNEGALGEQEKQNHKQDFITPQPEVIIEGRLLEKVSKVEVVNNIDIPRFVRNVGVLARFVRQDTLIQPSQENVDPSRARVLICDLQNRDPNQITNSNSTSKTNSKPKSKIYKSIDYKYFYIISISPINRINSINHARAPAGYNTAKSYKNSDENLQPDNKVPGPQNDIPGPQNDIPGTFSQGSGTEKSLGLEEEKKIQVPKEKVPKNLDLKSHRNGRKTNGELVDLGQYESAAQKLKDKLEAIKLAHKKEETRIRHKEMSDQILDHLEEIFNNADYFKLSGYSVEKWRDKQMKQIRRAYREKPNISTETWLAAIDWFENETWWSEKFYGSGFLIVFNHIEKFVAKINGFQSRKIKSQDNKFNIIE